MGKLKPLSAIKMRPTDAAWLAGFFDGEGHLGSYMGGRDRKYVCWHLAIANNEKQSLEKCINISGCGKIYLKSRASEKHKEHWHWVINAKNDIEYIITQILPYCIIKNYQINRFMESNAGVRHTGGS